MPADFPADPDDVTGCLEHALALVLEAEPLEQRIREASKDGRLTAFGRTDLIAQAEQSEVISAEDANLLHAADRAVRRAVDVDDFDPAAFGAAKQPPADPMADVA